MTQCTAKSKRRGERCRRHATPGREKCRFHGGKTPRGTASANFRHGLYSKYARQELAEKIEAFRELEEKLTDLIEVLALQHTLLADALERDDLEAATTISETISRNIVRHHKIEELNKRNEKGETTVVHMFAEGLAQWHEKRVKAQQNEKKGS